MSLRNVIKWAYDGQYNVIPTSFTKYLYSNGLKLAILFINKQIKCVYLKKVICHEYTFWGENNFTPHKQHFAKNYGYAIM